MFYMPSSLVAARPESDIVTLETLKTKTRRPTCVTIFRFSTRDSYLLFFFPYYLCINDKRKERLHY